MLNVQVGTFIHDEEVIITHDMWEDAFFIGRLIFGDKVGHFHYEWISQYVPRESLTDLRDAITLALDLSAKGDE